jgi:hypothetical protein
MTDVAGRHEALGSAHGRNPEGLASPTSRCVWRLRRKRSARAERIRPPLLVVGIRNASEPTDQALLVVTSDA